MPVFGKLKQNWGEFKADLGYTGSSRTTLIHLKKTKTREDKKGEV